ncbi:MAG: hypothetical protein NT031_17720 [Planctomycetota bacterium]|nr:hypothetical protein [Planctomycetota bacterium]
MLGLTVAVVYLHPPFWISLALGGMVLTLAILGFLDDVYSLSASIRFAVQLVVGAAATLLCHAYFFDTHEPTQVLFWVSVVFVAMFTVAFINFFNFMDGINGMACFQGLVASAAICLMVHSVSGSRYTVSISAALAGACLGFLPHNFPHARLFMGDTGSTMLGFLLAMLTFKGSSDTKIPWLALAMPMGVFIFDPVFTLFKRAIRHEKVTQAHREHNYQLLIRCGWSHIRVAALKIALMLVCAGAGPLYMNATRWQRLAIIGGLVLIAVCQSILIFRYFLRHRLDAPGAKPAIGPENPT